MATMQSVRVFIGHDPHGPVPSRVLAHSIMQRTEARVALAYTEGWDGPPEHHRWQVARRCGWEGVAVYLDPRQLCLSDIERLAAHARLEGGHVAWCPRGEDGLPLASAMVVDCRRARSHPAFRLGLGEFSAARLAGSCGVVDPTWAHADRRERGEVRRVALPSYAAGGGPVREPVTRMIRYVREATLPWLDVRSPLHHDWVAALVAALRVGMVGPSDVSRAIEDGLADPELRAVIDGLPIDGEVYRMNPKRAPRLAQPRWARTVVA